MNHKLEFARRLRAAMHAAGLEARPGILLNLFNTHYWGPSVTFQAVSRWLKGEAIPAQDKLVVLSSVLKIEPAVLRFGENVRQSPPQQRPHGEEGAGHLEHETFATFMRLHAPQRKLIREIIITFAKMNETRSVPLPEPDQLAAGAAGPRLPTRPPS